MSEQDPFFTINVNNEPTQFNRRNSKLYTFIGGLAVYDHLFRISDERNNGWGEVNDGYFIPAELIGRPVFDKIGRFMLENRFMADLNYDHVIDSDREAITRILTGNVGDTIPDDWV